MQKQDTSSPLAVDLDGSLIRTDLLMEAVLGLLKRNPLLLFWLPFWLLRGRAHLKHRVAERVELDIAVLPYHPEFLAFLKAQHGDGRRLILATAAPRKYADQIAEQLGIFEEILATELHTNLSGRNKLERLVHRFGEKGFDYAGNAAVDLKIWPHARQAILVNPGGHLERKARRRLGNIAHVLDKQRPSLWAYIRALRLYQWVKNCLIFVPLVMGHQLGNTALVIDTLLAFLAFGLTASSVYLVNDLLDLSADRHHPRKCERPFASGAVPVLHGVFLIPLLLLAAGLVAIQLPLFFVLTLACYFGVTLAYSLWLKHVVMLDVLVLAGLYTLRIIAGAAAIENPLTFWLLAFSMFIFLSLALIKRYSELMTVQSEGQEGPAGRRYEVGDLFVLQSLGATSGYLAVLVLALYINSPGVIDLYSHPRIIWLLCPLLLYWISRMWLITHRGAMHDDPIVFTFRDRTSLLIGALSGVVVWLAV